MPIEWRDRYIRVRLVAVPIWVCCMALDTWVSTGVTRPSWLVSLLPARAAFYLFQSAILTNNMFRPRYNIINVWQFAPRPVGTVGVLLSLGGYMVTWASVLTMLWQPDGHVVPEDMVTRARVLAALNLYFLPGGFKLYWYTTYRVLFKGERDYEMMPIVFADDDKQS